MRTLKEEAGSPGWRADEATSGLCASGRDQGPELGVRAGARAQEERVGLSLPIRSWLCFWLVELLASYPCNSHPGCWGCPTLCLPPRGKALCSGVSPGRRTQSPLWGPGPCIGGTSEGPGPGECGRRPRVPSPGHGCPWDSGCIWPETPGCCAPWCPLTYIKLRISRYVLNSVAGALGHEECPRRQV